MLTTTNLKLKKPEGTDTVNIDDFNYNADIIDAEMNKRALKTEIPQVPVTSVNNKTGAVELNKGDIGLGNVTNESKATMFNNAALTGTATAPTAAKGTNNTQLATTAFVAAGLGDKQNKTDNTLGTTSKNLVGAINEVYSKALEAFQSASDGKSKLATAITGKGINTNPSDTFDIMVANINKLSSVTIDGDRVNRNIDLEFDGFNWEFTSLSPLSYSGGSTIVYNNEIHLLGDISVSGSSGYTRHYKWNGTNWVSVSTLPFSFYSYSNSVVYNDELHIMGTGYSSDDYHKKHYKWNGTSWSYASTLPQAPSTESSVVLYNGEIYAMLNYYMLYKYTGSWIQLSSDYALFGITNFKMLVYNNEIHIFGATKHYKWSGTNWVSVSALPFSFDPSRGILEVINNKVHMFQYYGYTSDNTSYYYIWNGESWTKRVDLSFPVDSGNSLVFNNKIYSFDNSVQQKGTPVYMLK